MSEVKYTQLLGGEKIKGGCLYPDDDSVTMQDIYRKYALMPVQTHSLNVGIAEHCYDRFPDTDALVTFKRNLPIGVVTADCVPILIYVPDVEGVAAIHAGWKGTLGGIVDKTLDIFEQHGASASEMIVAFGPSISMKMYEVDEALAEKFREAGFSDYVLYPNGIGAKPHIDLQGVNIERLLQRGVKRDNITPNMDCTYSTVDADGQPVYQSHRRSNGAPGRNLTMICIR
ncbi:MAG: polyphenol oxidase family protein [Bacteroides sp.]|nr:polyphenol oxidase family protein [Bacteroides sp.]